MTSVGIMECKKALIEAESDLDKAADILRRKGIAKAGKRAARDTAEGVIESYIHPPGKIGVLVELNCETDFAARNEMFLELARDLTMHVAAAAPQWLAREDVPEEVIANEKEIYCAQAKEQGKPDKILERIAEGKLEKFYRDGCLMEQAFVKDPDLTITDLIKEKIAVIGENISVGRFTRFQIGEKTTED